ncbi:MAG TPA: histone deacetylase [Gammaproteobacteria bacterium]|jgi:acetoin utilization deacetylase AcuC-like enzyme|nr:histone deacetylase [Gammaproteobacteria bacterium]
MAKFQLLKDWVDLHVPETRCFSPSPCPLEILTATHHPAYVEGFQTGTLDQKAIREIGLPWSEGLRDRTLLALGGSIQTCELAREFGLASHLAGGTHHAHYDRGSGFCIYNDLAVSARYLVSQGLASRVLIFDCDVHQGDGTAAILANDAHTFTCSIHAEKNFPVRKVDSDLDVNCPDGMTDDAYVSLVLETLDSVIASWHPDFVIYDAGSDVHVDDALGRLSVTTEGLYARDYGVISRIRGLGIPCATVIGGGYDKDRARVAARHGVVVRAAQAVFAQVGSPNSL